MIGTKNELIKYLLEQDDTKKYEVKEFKKKRTLNQNAYYHLLLNELSQKIGVPSTELHFEYIKRSSPFIDILIPKEADTRAFEYYEVRNTIEKQNKLFKVVRVFTSSHLLNTIEMGILLDNLIEDCKENGISTMTSDELAKMRSLEKSIK